MNDAKIDVWDDANACRSMQSMQEHCRWRLDRSECVESEGDNEGASKHI